MQQMGHKTPWNVTSSTEWLADGYTTDPFLTYSMLFCIILIFVSVQTAFYSYKKDISKIYFKVCRKFWNNQAEVDITNNNTVTSNKKFEEIESNIIGTNLSTLLIVLGLVSVIPIATVKTQIKKNIQDINHGFVRTLFYVSKISMPMFTFLLSPIIIVAANSKLRKALIKAFKTSPLGKRIMNNG